MEKYKRIPQIKPISAVGIFLFSEEKRRSFPEAAGRNNCESLPDNLRHKSLEWNDNQRKALYSLYVMYLFSHQKPQSRDKLLLGLCRSFLMMDS